MQVVSVCSLKGGSGKTTLVGHLAVAAERRTGGAVAMIDVDPQGSLAAWSQDRQGVPPELVQAAAANLGGELQRLRERGCRVALIDTPAGAALPVQRAIEHGDLIVVPVRPSPHDLRAAPATLELAARAGKPAVLVLNGAVPGDALTADSMAALTQLGTLLPAVVGQHTPLVRAMAAGLTVLETEPDHGAARDILAVWNTIEERLVRLANRQAFQQRRPGARFFGRRTQGDEIASAFLARAW